MTLARVIGSVVSTIKHDCYQSKTILLCIPVDAQDKRCGKTMVAVDTIGAGIGDTVLVASEGRAAMEICEFPRRMPLRSIITAIVDRVDVPAQNVKQD
jgi:ethanolamine utilization protein EutN